MPTDHSFTIVATLSPRLLHSDISDFLSVANAQLAHLSDTLERVKGLYNKFVTKERVCGWKEKFNLGESCTQFLSINETDVPQSFAMQFKAGRQSSVD